MRVTMKFEIGKVCQHFFGSASRNFPRSHQSSETLHDLDVHEVRCMELALVVKETGLDSSAKRSLQQKLQQRRRVDDGHADSRSSRMATAAGVLSVTRLLLCSRASISSRVGRAARRPISARR